MGGCDFAELWGERDSLNLGFLYILSYLSLLISPQLLDRISWNYQTSPVDSKYDVGMDVL